MDFYYQTEKKWHWAVVYKLSRSLEDAAKIYASKIAFDQWFPAFTSLFTKRKSFPVQRFTPECGHFAPISQSGCQRNDEYWA